MFFCLRKESDGFPAVIKTANEALPQIVKLDKANTDSTIPAGDNSRIGPWCGS